MKKMYIRNRYIFLLDILSIFLAAFITYATVFPEMPITNNVLVFTAGIYSLCTLVVFSIFRVYKTMWSYSGTKELVFFLFVNVISVALVFFINETLLLLKLIPFAHRRINFVIFVLSVLAMTVVRMFAKEIHKGMGSRAKAKKINQTETAKRVLIIGAGDAGRIIINNSIANRKLNIDVVGFIDDDRAKIGKKFFGVKVLGTRNDIIRICDKFDIDQIILAIPSAYAEERSEILSLCAQTKCKVKTIPGISEIIETPEKENNIRDIQIEDLLDRDPIILDNNRITELVEKKVVMVTGGGGSIGSELCRQIMKYNPKTLIIVDIYENNAYDIQMELNDLYPNNKPIVLIASIRDKERLEEIFEEYKPQIVFHAAAHKHVPLMEVSPREAIKNNVFGTYNLAITADKFKVEKFVMISTDKAVNPTNVMGATKRLCEMIIQSMEKISDTDFVAVRFGNVLGSNGSVIPLFKRQIEKGGPVTVTHKDVIRFFMTIPEAAQLVIQAACYAKGGEIFILDMGKPVKIYNLAENIIKLSGYTPGVDIKIEVVGLRPGEKLYEELLMNSDSLQNTEHKKIFVDHPEAINFEQLTESLNLLQKALVNQNDDEVRDVLEKVVPTYIRDNEVFNQQSHIQI